MGLKIDMSEVHNMRSAIDSSLNSVNSKTSQLSSSMSKLIGTEGFEGKAATSVKNYTNSFHIKNIQKIKDINTKYKEDIQKSINKFESEVDNSQSAILDEDRIQEYKKEIGNSLKVIIRASNEANKAISKVNDLTTAKSIKTDKLTNDMSLFNKQISNTLERLNAFDKSSNDSQNTDDKIQEIVQLSSYVKGLSSNRARINATSASINKYKTENNISDVILATSNTINSVNNVMSNEFLNIIKNAVKESIGLKMIGGGSLKKAINMISKKGLEKSIDNLSDAQLRRISAHFETTLGNVKLKKIITAFNHLKAHGRKSELGTIYTSILNKKQQTRAEMLDIVKNKGFKNALNAKFSLSNIGKSALSGFAESVLPTDSYRLYKSLKKHGLKDFWDKGIKRSISKEIFDFKGSNPYGKFKMSTKYLGKAIKPLSIASVLHDSSKHKGIQKQLVNAGVDLGAIGASTAIGAGIGSTIPIPVVGSATGAVVGVVAGLAMDAKVFGGKSVTDWAKIGANNSINKVKDLYNDSTEKLKNTSKKFAEKSREVGKHVTKEVSDTSKKISKVSSDVVDSTTKGVSKGWKGFTKGVKGVFN